MERQSAKNLNGIAPDHRMRYEAVRALIGAERKKILDVGCGIGYGSYIMAVNDGHSVIGVDVSEEAIESAKENYSTELNRFVKADALEFVRTDEDAREADVAVAFEILEHLDEPDELLESLAQSAPVLFASVPNQDILPYTPDRFPYHKRHYTPAEFGALLEKHGWKIEEWMSQYDKWTGRIYSDADDGRTLIVRATRREAA